MAGDFQHNLEGIQMENKEIIREFNREGNEKLQSFQNMLKKDNREFFDNLQN